jgi:hypothetical protein
LEKRARVLPGAGQAAWSNGAPVNFGGVFQRLSIGAGWVWVALLAIRITHELRSMHLEVL